MCITWSNRQEVASGRVHSYKEYQPIFLLSNKTISHFLVLLLGDTKYLSFFKFFLKMVSLIFNVFVAFRFLFYF
jgi:hypothetical protein